MHNLDAASTQSLVDKIDKRIDTIITAMHEVEMLVCKNLPEKHRQLKTSVFEKGPGYYMYATLQPLEDLVVELWRNYAHLSNAEGADPYEKEKRY